MYCLLSSTENLRSILTCLRANQNPRILLIGKRDGLLLQSSSFSLQILGGGFLSPAEFDIYSVTDVELLIDLKVFRQAVLALGSAAQLVLEYPTKDNKLLVCVKDDWHSTRFYLNTFDVKANISWSSFRVLNINRNWVFLQIG